MPTSWGKMRTTTPCPPIRRHLASPVSLSLAPTRWSNKAAVCCSAKPLLFSVHDFGHLVQMWVDLVGQLIEIIPLLPKFRRLMSRSQQIAVLPLYVVDDAAPVQAAMQTDGDEARLARHEAGSFGHHPQCLGLLVWLGLDDCDLCDGLVVGLDLRHARPHFIELTVTLPLDFTEYNIQRTDDRRHVSQTGTFGSRAMSDFSPECAPKRTNA